MLKVLRGSTHMSDSVIFTDDKAKHEVRDLPNTSSLVKGMNYQHAPGESRP